MSLSRTVRMPAPVRIDGRKVWDIRSLDLAFDALPRENARIAGTACEGDHDADQAEIRQ